MNSIFSEKIRDRKGKAGITIIPDIKCISPKDGDLMRGRNPEDIALQLQKLGAPALSVVTEEKNFGGSMKLLESLAKIVNIPILRKDFINNKDDLKMTKDSGASAILLMCSVLPERLLTELYEQALIIGLEPFVEAHSENELQFADTLGAKLVGINNKNILELERDEGTVAETSRLAQFAPKDATLVSESSICSHAQALSAINAGADAVLVGTAILQAGDIKTGYNSICYGGNNKHA